MGDGVTDLTTLAALHARLILQARDCERLAERNPDHAEREAAEAAMHRAEAAALAALLAPHGVHVPDPRQLALFSDGVTR
jgi:hypothetical protein